MTGSTCHECGAIGYCENHHIIFKSQAKYMKSIGINQIFLCLEHHRGTLGVHHNKKLDLKLKQQLQTRLKTMFTDEFYNREGIQARLECTDIDIGLILKKLSNYTLGYSSEQLCRRLMGGRLY